MSINLVINEICCNFKKLIYKQLQTKIAMITEDKVIEIFCMADDFCKFFDAMTAKYTLKPTGKRKYHRNSTMSKAEVMLIMILFHDSGYRCFKHFYLEILLSAKVLTSLYELGLTLLTRYQPFLLPLFLLLN